MGWTRENLESLGIHRVRHSLFFLFRDHCLLQGSGFGVEGLGVGFGVQDSMFLDSFFLVHFFFVLRVLGFGFRISGSGFRVTGFWIQNDWFWVSNFGFGVEV